MSARTKMPTATIRSSVSLPVVANGEVGIVVGQYLPNATSRPTGIPLPSFSPNPQFPRHAHSRTAPFDYPAAYKPDRDRRKRCLFQRDRNR